MNKPDEFFTELKELFVKHGFALLGNLWFYDLSNGFLSDTLKIKHDGLFVDINCDREQEAFALCPTEKSPDYWDKEASFRQDAIVSMVDGKAYSNRLDYDNHLKANNCIEVGNDPAARRVNTEIRGDFNVEPELRRATQEVFQKRGLSY